MSNILVLYQCHFKTCCYNVTLTSYQWLYQHWTLNILLRCCKSIHTKRGQVCDMIFLPFWHMYKIQHVLTLHPYLGYLHVFATSSMLCNCFIKPMWLCEIASSNKMVIIRTLQCEAKCFHKPQHTHETLSF
jgi:hypothetical protein